ncbi:MAG: hypothetical protein U0T36_12890 [Saprospiraceae bacterium]|jgi:hypothetical protein
MNPTLKSIIAVAVGIIIGSLVNYGILSIGMSLIPPPDGIDTSTPEGLKAALPLFEFKHFMTPFLAHALGTLVGALVAAWISSTQKLRSALIVGFFFLLGGISMVVMLPAPLWFNCMDLILAYIPMAYLGYRLGEKI